MGFFFFPSTQVLATLVCLIFSIPSLQWDRPIEHFETFSGCMEVTKHEWLVPSLQIIALCFRLFGVVVFVLVFKFPGERKTPQTVNDTFTDEFPSKHASSGE